MPRFDVDIHEQAHDDFAARAADLPCDRAVALAAETLAQWGHDNASELLWAIARRERDHMAHALDADPTLCGMCGGAGCESCGLTGRAE